MALTSANRVLELQALDLRFRYYKHNGVLFKLASLTKKRQLGASLKDLKLNCDYMSEMSKCNTAQLEALPPQYVLHCSISYYRQVDTTKWVL